MASFKKEYKVLVIEDNEGDYKLVEMLLQNQSDEPLISRVKSFAEASSVLTAPDVRFDIVLLDLTLPDKGGIPLIKDILSICPITPVIVLTGFADFDYGAKSLTLGVADYILKSELDAFSLMRSIVYSKERKMAFLAFEESERRYSEIFKLCPLPIFVFDTETLKFLDVNIAATVQYGYSYKEFLAMTIDDIRPPEEIEKLRLTTLKFMDQTGEAHQGIFVHRKRTGENFSVDIKSNVIKYRTRRAKIIVATELT